MHTFHWNGTAVHRITFRGKVLLFKLSAFYSKENFLLHRKKDIDFLTVNKLQVIELTRRSLALWNLALLLFRRSAYLAQILVLSVWTSIVFLKQTQSPYVVLYKYDWSCILSRLPWKCVECHDLAYSEIFQPGRWAPGVTWAEMAAVSKIDEKFIFVFFGFYISILCNAAKRIFTTPAIRIQLQKKKMVNKII